MDKRKLGTIVGVVGVAGTVVATQLIDIDTSAADYMSKDLVQKLEESQNAKQVENDSQFEEKTVYDNAQKIEYVISVPKEESVQQSSLSETVESKELSQESEESSEEKQPEEVAQQDVNVAPQRKVVESVVQVSETEEVEESVVEETVEAPVEESVETPVEESVEEPVIAEERAFEGVVAVEALNIRSDSTQEAEAVGYLEQNDIVKGTLYNGWVKLIEGDLLVGYVNASYITEKSAEEIAAIEAEIAAAEEAAAREAEEQAAREAEEAAAREAEEQAAREAEEAAAREAEEAAAREAEEAAAREAEEQAAREAEEAAAREAEEAAAREAATTPRTYWTTAGVNIRSSASTSGSVVGGLNKGSEIYGTVENGWVKLNDGRGYVAFDFVTDTKPSYAITTPEETEPEAPVEEVVVEYASGYAAYESNVRKGPGTSYARIGSVSVNTYIEGELVNGWVKFDYNGSTGYIKQSLLSAEKISIPVEEETPQNPISNVGVVDAMIAAGYAKIGTPYVWGGNGPYSFDCSGFTSWLFRNYAGITLNRNSQGQYQNGYAVSKANLVAGDLVFFNTNGYSISHVGLYIGNGQVIHATTVGGVRVDNINSGYWANIYVGARRVLN